MRKWYKIIQVSQEFPFKLIKLILGWLPLCPHLDTKIWEKGCDAGAIFGPRNPRAGRDSRDEGYSRRTRNVGANNRPWHVRAHVLSTSRLNFSMPRALNFSENFLPLLKVFAMGDFLIFSFRRKRSVYIGRNLFLMCIRARRETCV